MSQNHGKEWMATAGNGALIGSYKNDTSESSGTVPVSNTVVPGPMEVVVSGGRLVLVSCGVIHGGHVNRFALYLDGSQVFGPTAGGVGMTGTDNPYYHVAIANFPILLASGSHTIALYWSAQGSTTAVTFYNRWLVVTG